MWLWAAPALAQAQGWGDCAGQVILLGTASQPEGARFTYWASLSNPGMRPVRVEARFGEGPAQPALRIEGGRMERLRLGGGPERLPAEAIAAATLLRCQMVPTRP
jgi:hypothetical protein